MSTNYEEIIRTAMPDAYEALCEVIVKAPDFRPLSTVESMVKSMPYNSSAWKWYELHRELVAIGTPSDRNIDVEILESLGNGTFHSYDYIADGPVQRIITKKFAQHWVDSYPLLSWILVHLYTEQNFGEFVMWSDVRDVVMSLPRSILRNAIDYAFDPLIIASALGISSDDTISPYEPLYIKAETLAHGEVHYIIAIMTIGVHYEITMINNIFPRRLRDFIDNTRAFEFFIENAPSFLPEWFTTLELEIVAYACLKRNLRRSAYVLLYYYPALVRFMGGILLSYSYSEPETYDYTSGLAERLIDEVDELSARAVYDLIIRSSCSRKPTQLRILTTPISTQYTNKMLKLQRLRKAPGMHENLRGFMPTIVDTWIHIDTMRSDETPRLFDTLDNILLPYDGNKWHERFKRIFDVYSNNSDNFKKLATALTPTTITAFTMSGLDLIAWVEATPSLDRETVYRVFAYSVPLLPMSSHDYARRRVITEFSDRLRELAFANPEIFAKLAFKNKQITLDEYNELQATIEKIRTALTIVGAVQTKEIPSGANCTAALTFTTTQLRQCSRSPYTYNTIAKDFLTLATIIPATPLGLLYALTTDSTNITYIELSEIPTIILVKWFTETIIESFQSPARTIKRVVDEIRRRGVLIPLVMLNNDNITYTDIMHYLSSEYLEPFEIYTIAMTVNAHESKTVSIATILSARFFKRNNYTSQLMNSTIAVAARHLILHSNLRGITFDVLPIINREIILAVLLASSNGDIRSRITDALSVFEESFPKLNSEILRFVE